METREPELILLYADILDRLSTQVGADAKFLLQGIFECILPMVTQDFSSYPDHRMNFFVFLKAAVSNSFIYLISIEQEQFKIILNCLLWEIKHELANIYEIGLETLQIILNVISF